MERLWPSKDLSELDSVLHRGYMHGPAGLILFEKDRKAVYSDSVTDWMRSVAAHHGSMSPVDLSVKTERFGPDLWKERDERVRFQMTSLGRDLFLKDFPEENIGEPPYGLLGFCSVCDWLASNEEWFPYRSESVSPEDYMDERFSLAETALRECGLIGYRSGRCGMDGLFPGWTPRGIQTLSLEDLDDGFPSLAVMEAPTGSGKTEAALALASRWVADGRADSVIFALPTQATANAMFDRLTRIAPVLFPGSANVVLAHGKSRFNSGFRSIMERGAGLPLGEDGLVQCSRWLASGKKRAFLGQIGVCTVDQVLLSVLPVRHGFVRSFGISRSVLIVDEVHAYDSYMNGLLEQVLQFQRDSGGCAILLSATLQHSRLLRLTSLWSGQDASLPSSNSYPLVTLARPGSIDCRIPFDSPPKRIVSIETIRSDCAIPDDELLERLVKEAESGKTVAFICNLVDHAQRVARKLKSMSSVPVDLFHARYTFRDRAVIESHVIHRYGPGRTPGIGGILVATQVVEQSLDLDFDLMVSQICPADLLFQRLGRLHRHDSLHGDGVPPKAIVLTPTGDDFGLHGIVYENEALLWRTRIMLEERKSITFPDAYRDWIETIYGDEPMSGEPDHVTEANQEWRNGQMGKEFAAISLVKSSLNLSDTGAEAAKLTRDGEMSLTVLPYDCATKCLMDPDGTPLASVSDMPGTLEVVDMQAVSVPAGWGKYLGKLERRDGIFFLPVDMTKDGWETTSPIILRYSSQFGLERVMKER
jgi:CRISPR-associated endonuclease/helicase Cas3